MVEVQRQPVAAAWTPMASPRQPVAVYSSMDIPLCACPGSEISTGILRSPDSPALPKHVSFTNNPAEWIYKDHDTQYVGGERAYWSWHEHGDHNKPHANSQTRHKTLRRPRVSVDVTSDKFLNDYRRDSLESHAAAIQNGIDLSEGHGLQFDWDEENNVAIPTEPYEGTRSNSNRDNRKRPLVWSRRHARLYSDPHGGSFGWDKNLFEVMAFRQGRAHPEYDDFLHMGLEPGKLEAQAIRRSGLSGNTHRSFKRSREAFMSSGGYEGHCALGRSLPSGMDLAPASSTTQAIPPQRSFIELGSTDATLASLDCYRVGFVK